MLMIIQYNKKDYQYIYIYIVLYYLKEITNSM